MARATRSPRLLHLSHQKLLHSDGLEDQGHGLPVSLSGGPSLILVAVRSYSLGVFSLYHNPSDNKSCHSFSPTYVDQVKR